MSLLRAVLGRIAAAAGIIAAASVLVWFGIEALPGDAATAALGREATPELLAQKRAELGLDRPLLLRFASWVGGFATGDLGASFISGEPVAGILAAKARNTLVLAGITVAMLVPVALALALAAEARRDRLADLGIAAATLLLVATPEFVIGTVLAVVVGVWLGWAAPVALIDSARPLGPQLHYMVLPAATLLLASLAQTTRMIRAALIDTLDAPHVQMAVLKGVRPWKVVLGHALPNALGPTIQVIVFNVAWLAGGVVVVETLFQFPGLGAAFVSAVSGRDLPLVAAVAILITAIYVLLTLLGDLAMIAVDPRQARVRA